MTEHSAPSFSDNLTVFDLSALLGSERMETVECLPTVGSTNDRLRELSLGGAIDGQVVIADSQERGRGRRGRAFVSPGHRGIYLSILLRPDGPPADVTEITAWTAVAVSRAIEEVCGVRPGIKWVNDLVFGGKKVCGILTEMSLDSESGGLQSLIIGIGINVNGKPSDFPEELRQTVTTIEAETGRPHARARLAAALIRELDKMRLAWPREKREYLAAYRADNITPGREITVVRGDSEKRALAVCINDDFSLQVRYPDGQTEALSGGEITLRGIYG